MKRSTLVGWAGGRGVQNLDDLKKICAALEVSLHGIFGGAGPFESHDFEEVLIWGKLKLPCKRLSKVNNTFDGSGPWEFSKGFLQFLQTNPNYSTRRNNHA